MRNSHTYLRQFSMWRARHITDRQFIYAMSIIIGLMSGAAAVVLKNAVHFVEFALNATAHDKADYLYFIFPAIGILLVVIIQRFVIKENVGDGIPNMLYAISKNNGNIGKKATWSSIITASITVGFGGSVGLEGPTVATAGAISSNLGQALRMDYKRKKLFIALAATGALSAIFSAPIAAIVFSLEVIMIDLTVTSLIPILLSSASAAIMSRLFLGDEYLFHFKNVMPYTPSELFFFVLLGVVTGLVSVYFINVYKFTEKRLKKINNIYFKGILGGALLGGLLYLFPQFYGEGYEVINDLIEGNISKVFSDNLIFSDVSNAFFVLLFLISLPLLKAIATSITLNSGGIGGVFAPSLFIGSTTGFMFATFFESIGLTHLSRSNYTLVGMAGVLAGTLHAPLTAIFLIAEITGGYTLFLPLMITAAISFMAVKYFVSHSIYTWQLAERGELITHHKDRAILTLMKLRNEIETNFLPTHPYSTLGELVQVISRSSRNLFPVIDDNGIFMGVVNLNDIRNIMFDKEQYDKVYVHDIMTPAPEYIYENDTMDRVMEKFDHSGAWNLPVVTEDHRYIGFVSKSKLFSAYRKLLRDFYDDGD